MKHKEKHFRYGWRSLIERRKEFRENPTDAEAILWDHLKGKKFNNLKFRRQHGIGPFVVDFYHGKTRTVIEIDGNVHEQAVVKEYDESRQKYLEELGYSFLRFKNEEIFHNSERVLEAIFHHIQKQMS